ncbi:MAG: pyrroline-5-carboxylate reductase [Alphaproteobacteria bacterium]|nr:pyrroline-5-carboxylate reductase [Alphaproteobacteria bacterium]
MPKTSLNKTPLTKTPLNKKSILLVGAGKMGCALLDGWLDAGFAASQFNVLEPNPDALLTARGGEGVSLAAPTSPADIIVLAIKPQLAEAVVPTLRDYIKEETMILSILAGTPTQKLEALTGHGVQVRAMPNTPAAIGAGITALYATPNVSAAQRGFAETLMQAVGESLWVAEEGLIDVVTAISGSGPAYIFYLAEVLTANGVRLGLPQDIAERLANHTIKGAGDMLMGDTPAAQLRQNVTSPGGTTEAALELLMVELPELMKKVIFAAFHRAKELSQSPSEEK